MTIRQLPPTLVDRIAAGEVVERPAAVVKELVENAIDAGAGRVEVALREGGLALIAVTDDGSGMSPDELTLAADERVLLRLPAVTPDLVGAADPDDEGAAARRQRLSAILGREFADNALAIDAQREGFRLVGLAGLPTLNRATSRDQYLFVNGRPVRDKLLVGAVRGAYQDFLARDRHPMVVLFLDCPESEVDVNVHPAKAEVRFRDSARVRGLIVGALRNALAGSGHQASTTVADAALGSFRPGMLLPIHGGGFATAGGY